MKKADAEEYTQSLGQIVGGSWRQILWAEQQGIPKALGLSTRDWAQQRLGGYVRMAIDDRRKAVKEMAANGHSTRQIADVVGVAIGTVHSDLHVQDRTDAPGADDRDDDTDRDDVQDRTPPPDDSAREERRQAELQRQRRIALARNLSDIYWARTEFGSESHRQAVVNLLRDFPGEFEKQTRMSPKAYLLAVKNLYASVIVIEPQLGATSE